jgi:hypothetical protein
VAIRNLNFVRAVFFPDEANPVLVVDSDTVLTSSIAFQSFQTIPRRHS